MLDKKNKRVLVNSNDEVIAEFPISNFEVITATVDTLAKWIWNDRVEQSDWWYQQCGHTVEEIKKWLESEAD